MAPVHVNFLLPISDVRNLQCYWNVFKKPTTLLSFPVVWGVKFGVYHLDIVPLNKATHSVLPQSETSTVKYNDLFKAVAGCEGLDNQREICPEQ